MIEVVISAGIIVLMSALILASIPTLRRQTKTNDAASTILVAAQDVREKSVATKKFFTTDKFPSYGAYFDTAAGSNKRVILYADCVDDDTGDGTLNNSDTFAYDPSSNACGAPSPNGLVETRVLDPQVSIQQLRLIGPVTTNVQRAYIEFVPPQPSIWISGWNPPGTVVTPLDYGELEITVQDDQSGNTRKVHLWTSGNMNIE